MKLRNLPSFKRPREKLQDRGAQGLTDSELLALVLQTGYQGRDALELAEQFLKNRTLSQLLALPSEKLHDLRGLGPSKAALLQAVKAIAERYTHSETPIIKTPKDALSLIDFLKHKKQEHLLAIYLNARYQLITQETITIGTLDSSLIHPREVFAPAIHYRAAHVILAHNHPSGDPQPSQEDVLTTQRLVEVGQLLDINLVDHIVVAKEGWQSMKQLNLL